MPTRQKKWQPKRVRSEEERGGGKSEFMRLDEGERFLGYALFEGDPAVDEPGYYEYVEHWDNNARRSIPCAGDECPLCEDGDKPKVRALTLWLVTRDEKGNDLGDGELRIFQCNWNVIKLLTEMRAEGDKVKGVQFRVTRTDDRGNYMMMPKNETLKATEIKELLKSDDAPDFDAIITNRLNKAMEGYSVRKALDDDDDDDKPSSRSSSRRGRKEEPDEEPEDEPTGDEFPLEEPVDVYVFEADDEKLVVGREGVEEQIEVYAVDGLDISEVEPETWWTIEVEARDDDGDYLALTSIEPAEEPAAEPEEEEESGGGDNNGDLPSEIIGEIFEVAGEVSEDNGSIPVKNDEYEFLLYVLEGVDVDWADYEEGVKVKINAEKAIDGDMVTSEPPEVQKTSSRGGTTGARRSAGGATKKKAAAKSTAKKSTSKASTKKTSSKATSKSKSKTATRRSR